MTIAQLTIRLVALMTTASMPAVDTGHFATIDYTVYAVVRFAVAG